MARVALAEGKLSAAAREVADHLLAELDSTDVSIQSLAVTLRILIIPSHTYRLFITTEGQPLPEKGPPTLSLDAILTTARVSFADPTLDLDDIECMCASLMDQVSPVRFTHPLARVLNDGLRRVISRRIFSIQSDCSFCRRDRSLDSHL